MKEKLEELAQELLDGLDSAREALASIDTLSKEMEVGDSLKELEKLIGTAASSLVKANSDCEDIFAFAEDFKENDEEEASDE